MRRKVVSVLVLCLFLIVLCGCKDEAGSLVRVSMVQSSQDGPKSISIPQGYSLTTSADYDELLRGDVLHGVLLASITPDYIILDVSKLQLFNSKDVQANIFNTNGDAVKVYEDYHNAFNMLHTRGLELNVPKDISNVWHHLLMSFTCWTGQATYASPSGYNDYFTVNMVGIKLPPSVPEGAIQGMTFSDRNREYLTSFIPDFDDYIWLSFSSLSPFNTSTPSAIVFSDTISTPQVYAKTGEGVSYYCIGNGNPKDSSNSTIIELPMETLDFRGIENPELVISYDAENLVNIYTDEFGNNYFVCFNPENPFPLSLSVREMSYETDSSSPSGSGGEVPPPIGCSKNRFKDTEDGKYIELLFTMPNDSNVNGVEIYYSTINDLSTAKLLYEGCSAHYRHKPSSPDPNKNYYWIRSVTVDGRKSQFIEMPTGYYAEK